MWLANLWYFTFSLEQRSMGVMLFTFRDNTIIYPEYSQVWRVMLPWVRWSALLPWVRWSALQRNKASSSTQWKSSDEGRRWLEVEWDWSKFFYSRTHLKSTGGTDSLLAFKANDMLYKVMSLSVLEQVTTRKTSDAIQETTQTSCG